MGIIAMLYIGFPVGIILAASVLVQVAIVVAIVYLLRKLIMWKRDK